MPRYVIGCLRFTTSTSPIKGSILLRTSFPMFTDLCPPQTYNNAGEKPNKSTKNKTGFKTRFQEKIHYTDPLQIGEAKKQLFFLFAPHSWRNFAAIYRDTTTAKWNIISETSKSGGARRGLAKALTRRSPRAIARNSTSSTCFPTLRAPACTSVTRWATSLPISMHAIVVCAATMCSTPWAMTPTGCPQSNMPSKRGSILR